MYVGARRILAITHTNASLWRWPIWALFHLQANASNVLFVDPAFIPKHDAYATVRRTQLLCKHQTTTKKDSRFSWNYRVFRLTKKSWPQRPIDQVWLKAEYASLISNMLAFAKIYQCCFVFAGLFFFFVAVQLYFVIKWKFCLTLLIGKVLGWESVISIFVISDFLR